MTDIAAVCGRSTSHIMITRVIRRRFVEFEYSLDNDDLSVELIMPFKEFGQFCAESSAIMSVKDHDALAEYRHYQKTSAWLPEVEVLNEVDKQTGNINVRDDS